MSMCYYHPFGEVAAILGGIVTVALIVCAIVAYFMAISAFVKTARAKNSPLGNGKLWFIGLFATPIVLGILVAAQPDRSGSTAGPGRAAAEKPAADGAPTAPAVTGTPTAPAAPSVPTAPTTPSASA